LNSRKFEYEEVGMGDRPNPCISNPEDLHKERVGEQQVQLNLPDASMLGNVAENGDRIDVVMQVNLPIDAES